MQGLMIPEVDLQILPCLCINDSSCKSGRHFAAIGLAHNMQRRAYELHKYLNQFLSLRT